MSRVWFFLAVVSQGEQQRLDFGFEFSRVSVPNIPQPAPPAPLVSPDPLLREAVCVGFAFMLQAVANEAFHLSLPRTADPSLRVAIFKLAFESMKTMIAISFANDLTAKLMPGKMLMGDANVVTTSYISALLAARLPEKTLRRSLITLFVHVLVSRVNFPDVPSRLPHIGRLKIGFYGSLALALGAVLLKIESMRV